MRVDQSPTFTNQFQSKKLEASSSGDSFLAAFDLAKGQPSPLEDDDESGAPVHGTLTESNISHSGNTSSSLLDELSKWAHMSPAEKIRAQWLGAHGMTEDSFSQLSSEDQAAINKQIAEEVTRQLAGDTDHMQVTFG
jgi:hypothetical protein